MECNMAPVWCNDKITPTSHKSPYHIFKVCQILLRGFFLQLVSRCTSNQQWHFADCWWSRKIRYPQNRSTVWCTGFPVWTVPEHMLVRLVGYCTEKERAPTGSTERWYWVSCIIGACMERGTLTGMGHVFWTHAVFFIPDVCWNSGIYTNSTIQSTESVALYLVCFLLFCQLDVFFPFPYITPSIVSLMCVVCLYCITLVPDVFRLVITSHGCHVALHPLHGFFCCLLFCIYSCFVFFSPFSIPWGWHLYECWNVVNIFGSCLRRYTFSYLVLHVYIHTCKDLWVMTLRSCSIFDAVVCDYYV